MTESTKQDARNAAIAAAERCYCPQCAAPARVAADLGGAGILYRCSKTADHRPFIVPFSQSAKALDFRRARRNLALKTADRVIRDTEAREEFARR